MAKKRAATAEPQEAKQTRFQKWPTDTIHRSRLKNAPYNPRKIDKHARKKLQKLIQSFGMLQEIVWNKRSGNVVGGHQRLSCLDALEGTDNYLLEVRVVDVDEKTEIEMNLSLNNQSAQGVYDMEMLDGLLQEGKFDIASAGFDPIDLELMYVSAGMPTDILDSMFSPAAAEEQNQAMSEIDALQDEADEISRGERVSLKAKTQDELHAEAEAREAERIAEIKRKREAFSERATYENENDFYVTLTFATNAQKHAFMKALQFRPEEPYIDGSAMAELLRIKLP